MRVPPFTAAVPDDGYSWWYLDAQSDDGHHALTVIFFIGSVFSPYYARARARGPAPALDHCAVNAVLYGTPARWAMTERTRASVVRTPEALAIGRSAMRVTDDGLLVTLDEVTAPLPSRLAGTLRVRLPTGAGEAFTLDTPGAHLWQPIAPQTRIEVALDAPALVWSGTAYVDSNRGAVPLERSFTSWAWSRGHAPDGHTRVRYDVLERSGTWRRRTLSVAPDNAIEERLAGDAGGERLHALPPTRWWRIPRPTRLAAGERVHDLQTLEDTPFYSRSRFREGAAGESGRDVVHESLELDRFDTALARTLLPVRMPRRRATVRPPSGPHAA